MDLKILKDKTTDSFNPKNYKNSPIVRDFYRFLAKNGLRAEAHKILTGMSNRRDRTSYISKLSENIH